MTLLGLITLLAPPIAITAPPERLAHDGFYKKYVSLKGLPILGSEKV